MPCSNITEQIQVTLDGQEHLRNYRFFKESCGQGIGTESLLLSFLSGLTIDDILAISDQQILTSCNSADDIERFLRLKHLFAVQSALEVYTGEQSGGKGSICTVVGVRDDNGEILIDADIDLGLVTDKIKACDGCSGCGDNLSPMDV